MAILDFDMPFKDVETSSLTAAVVKRRRKRARVSNVKNFPRRATNKLIGDLESHSTRSHKDRVTSALIVRELRERVEAGLMGKVTWYSWARKNINLGQTRLKEHMRVANARDPGAEVRRLMKLAEARAMRLEENQARRDAAEWERRSVINFANKAPLDQVQMLQRLVSKMPRLT